MIPYIILFFLFLCFSIFDFASKKQNNYVLSLLCLIAIIFIGFRGESGTDSLNYIDYFKNNTDVIWKWTGVIPGYNEIGFYWLSVLIKSICNNYTVYFLVISLITILFLKKSLRSYCLYPIIGFCVYYSRFMLLRDMNQIRQALAIVICIYALKYLINNNKSKFILYTIFSALMHYSLIIVLPFTFLCNLKINIKQLVFILFLSALFGVGIGAVLKPILISLSSVKLLHYVSVQNLGLTNPMIYYQCGILVLYFYFDKRLSNTQKGYFIIRNAYLYSTIILLATCGLGDIGGRLATIFSTCEIFIIPSFIKVIRPRFAGYFFISILISALFYMNYVRIMNDSVWIY